MTTTCPCGAPVPEAGLWLCRACEQDLVRHLTRAPSLLADLQDEARRATAKAPSPGGRSGERALPVDMGAVDIRRALEAVLRDLEAMLPTPGPTGSSPRVVVARILGGLRTIRRRTEITVFARDLADATRRAVGKVDQQPERVMLGACHCGHTLTTTQGAAHVRCRWCGAVWVVAELLEARRDAVLDELSDARLRAVDMEAALALLGHPTPAATIRQWGARGRLVADGEGRYLVADALDLAERARLRAA